MDNIYEIDTNFEFTSEQLRLLLGTNDKDKANECDHNSDSSGDIVVETNVVETNDDDIVEANNVVEANDDDVVDLPELIDLDDEKDTKRVTDNLLVIARKALLGV